MSSTERGPWHLVFRDEHLLVVNKPPGIPVQPDRTGDACLLQPVQNDFPEYAMGSPHRIDRPVSGLVVFTLDAAALRDMDRLFREQQVMKKYLAVVEGRPGEQGSLVHRLAHAGGSRKAAVTGPGQGKQVQLHYRMVKAGERYTLLEVEPQGGAYHQIRAQLAAAGLPIKGDVKYGARRGEKDRSIALHAWRLQFRHPATGDQLCLEAPVPANGIWMALQAAR